MVIDEVTYQPGDADNAYYDITQPTGTTRPSVITLRRDLQQAIDRRQEMYNTYGLENMYFAHLNERLNQTIAQQLQYLEENQQEGWAFNPEVAQGEITTAFYANYENAYVPHSPEDYTLSPYQWYEASNNSQSSTSQNGTVTYNTEPFKYRRERGVTYYELSNHLGNVLVTVTDMKIGIEGGTNWVAEYYEATVVSAVDYYPFGSAMAGRKYNQGTYRYGFNGKEEDKEWGSQMIQDYGFRIYNPTIGKFLSVDPLSSSYPWYTPYQFAGNMPIWVVDLDGLEELIYLKSFDKYKKGVMDVINSDKELLAKYNSYQDKTKNNIKIYIDVVGLAGVEQANTRNVSGEIHFFKQVEDYISSGGKLADFSKNEIATYNEGKVLANRLGLQTKDISLNNEYEIITINARMNRPAEVGQKDTEPYTWDKLLLVQFLLYFMKLMGM
ncbi:MAG: hypothetical protein HC803_06540 [Saprospiraceae bacterium]|nr:hypothetical protein [Saprospiraceae bacterium]